MKYAIVHIADIHYRREEPEGVSKIINGFIDDLKNQKSKLTDYEWYLAATGDVVYEGRDAESYSSFINEFDKKFNEIGLTRDFRIMVPGNHDVDRDIVESDLAKYQSNIYDKIESEPKFNDFVSSPDYIERKFENYELFESDFAKYGIDYSTQGKGWLLNDNLGVFCLNTALCSFGGVEKIKDKHKLAVYTRGLMTWCNASKASINILLMHHPIFHLNQWSKKEIKQIIEDNFSLCLCGHEHEQDIYPNNISHRSLICSAPQLFTKKGDRLGYSIICIEENSIDKIIYRQFEKGSFLSGQSFTGNDEGIVYFKSDRLECIKKLEGKLINSLAYFKNQSGVFIKPKISKEREFSHDENLLDKLIENPQSSIIVAQPQFGLTCLSHYMRLEAFKNNNFWIYLDAKYIKARNISSLIAEQWNEFAAQHKEINCIIIDSWDSSIIDHRNMLTLLAEEYENVPIYLMSNYSELYFNSNFNFSKLNREFNVYHLQALERNKVREFVSKHTQANGSDNEDSVVTKIVKDLDALNIHRTPLNCLTLLKVIGNNFNENLVNRTKMIKAVLFILFTDADSFTYSSNKPEVDDCEYILGNFCKKLILNRTRVFALSDFVSDLENYCEEKLIKINVETLVDILESNNILIRFNNDIEFKHSYWIYYFASICMLHDEEFKKYVLHDKNYVNFPEIIEFYTGIDGRRDDAIKVLVKDMIQLIDQVDSKVGIKGEFNPFAGIVWNPSEDSIKAIRDEISNKVEESNLPTIIKDQHADQTYNSEAPYDQSINKFLSEYSVVSLIQGISASSRALRNSNYVDSELKKELIQAVFNGWERMSKVFFFISPVLAQDGKVIYEGLGLTLMGGLTGTASERYKNIYLSNPYNVVRLFKDNLSSKKIGPLIFDVLNGDTPDIIKQFIALFLISERPIGWQKEMFDFINLCHRNSFIISDIKKALKNELEKGFVSKEDRPGLKLLLTIIFAKHENAGKSNARKDSIPLNMVINKKNKLPLDKIIASGRKPLFLK